MSKTKLRHRINPHSTAGSGLSSDQHAHVATQAFTTASPPAHVWTVEHKIHPNLVLVLNDAR